MGILGIENRTENWKTVQHFHGLPDETKVCLVKKLGEPAGILAGEISTAAGHHQPPAGRLDWDDMDETAEQAIERAINAC